ncbi:MAG TPA: NAD(+)/NADH kinase [Firmicutes bacterium]|jgi:NAD+ kinase|nr:NAD(+)/NADH kinase [Bacillota bacterium]
MRGIGLIPNWQKENSALVVERICDFFEQRGVAILTAAPEQTDYLAGGSLGERLNYWRNRVDIFIVVGGDGTILRAARDLAAWEVPILGINLGHKGFLAEIEVEQMDRYLQYVLTGRYQFLERMMLQAAVMRKGEMMGQFIALNDIVISRGPFSRILTLNTTINDNFLESYSGDGVIIATPTGSTGYSLSAGGPIVNPSLELIVITPICPHSLNNRAVIATAEERICMRVDTRQAQVVLTADGQVAFSLEDGDEIFVQKSEQKVKLVHFGDNFFYRLLHQKLKD